MENIVLVPADELIELAGLVKKEGAGQAVKNIYGYILASGAVREDVYRYLIANSEYEPYSVQYINELIKFFASPEWFELIRNAEHKSDKGEMICRLYQQSILSAFKEGLNAEETGEWLNNALYPYELDLWIMEKRRKMQSGNSSKKDGDNPAMPAAWLTELMTMAEAVTGRFDEICSRHEEILSKIFSELVREKLQNEIIDGKTATAAVTVTADARDSVVVAKETEENIKSVMKTAKKMNTDSAVSIGHIFQRIRNKKHRSEFLKLSGSKKIEELFMLIRKMGYDNELIGKVRKCLENGVTCEFLYVFIESGADENDFDNLITFIKKKEEEKK